MPKSKRNKQVDLTKTKKHGIEGKKNLYNEIRTCVDTYAHVFVFSVNDMRNSKMKQVREQWRHSRFFIGKNKVMAIALGRYAEEAYRTNLHRIGEQLKGQKGILFSNQSVDEVLKFFSSYTEGDFARSGNIATEDVTLSEGPLQFPHSLESYLRQLGLPTTLKKGVIHLVKDHVVCRNGEQLTPEAARILKLLGYEMAEFQIRMECVWSQDGTFQVLRTEVDDEDVKRNKNDSFKGPVMNEEFQLTQDLAGLGDEDDEEMELDENDVEVAPVAEKETLKAESNTVIENGVLTNEKDSDMVEETTDLKKRSLKKKSSKVKNAEDKTESDSSQENGVEDAMEIIKIDELSNKCESPEDSVLKKIIPDLEEKSMKGRKSGASRKVKSNENAVEESGSNQKNGEEGAIEIVSNEKESQKDADEGILDLEQMAPKGRRSRSTKRTRNVAKETEKSYLNQESEENDQESVDSTIERKTKDVADSVSENEFEKEEETATTVSKRKSTQSKTARAARKRKNIADAMEESDSKQKKQIGGTKEVDENKNSIQEEEAVDTDSILKITQEKIELTEVKPTKYSPKMTRARAAKSKKDDPKPPASAVKTPRAAALKKEDPKPPASAAKTPRKRRV